MPRPIAASDPVGKVFQALVHPVRRQLLGFLSTSGGRTLGELVSEIHLTCQTVTQHLDVLEEAGILVTRRFGREKLHYFNPVPLAEVFRDCVAPLITSEATALLAIRDEIEQTSDRKGATRRKRPA
jgi:DNA-binding transcriptional ArsR family regulator